MFLCYIFYFFCYLYYVALFSSLFLAVVIFSIFLRQLSCICRADFKMQFSCRVISSAFLPCLFILFLLIRFNAAQSGCTPVFKAANDGKLEALVKLVALGANVRHQDWVSITLMWFQISNNPNNPNNPDNANNPNNLVCTYVLFNLIALILTGVDDYLVITVIRLVIVSRVIRLISVFGVIWAVSVVLFRCLALLV